MPKTIISKRGQKAWVVAVDMGYGHERAAYALKELSQGNVILANNYPGIPKHDRTLWEQSRTFYEQISRLKPTPIIGNILFEAMDKLQEIPEFYPRRDLSKPSIQLRQIYRLIRKHQYGKDLIDRLREKALPFVSTFFLPAFFAEEFNYPGNIYCVICDADMSRTWAGLDPRKSRIKFFAPNGRVVERLRLYGVRSENIFLTGFPLPKENIGSVASEVIKKDISTRLVNLDPHGYFRKRYEKSLQSHLGKNLNMLESHRPLTLTFAVGGAGAQKKIGIEIVKSLQEQIHRHEIIVQLALGIRKDIAQFFHQELKKFRFTQKEFQKYIRVLFFPNRKQYFRNFCEIIRKSDILWTKPSELSFYTGLGLPIIMAPPIGSQEDFNRFWLWQMGSGVDQLNPRYTNEWLFDWISSGGLARMAWNGFIEAPTHGAFRIEEVITNKKVLLEPPPFIV